MNLSIREASKKDYSAIVDLLKNSRLPSADLIESCVHLFVGNAEDGDVIASVGLEKYGSVGLLRSLAVNHLYRNQKAGDRLLKHVLAHCHLEGINDLYLLTTTAEKYFEKYSFVRVNRADVPESVRQTKEFESICPASAAVMHLLLSVS